MNKGIILVLFTAFVSGFSIFINAFAVKGMNPFLFTTAKNSLVAFLLFSILFLVEKKEFGKVFSKNLLPKLLAIGFIGGSIPFLLFFYALSLLKSPAIAGFIHKTLFLWATLFAVIFIKEKVSVRFMFAAFLLLLGNYLFFLPQTELSLPVVLVLIATIFWAAENVLAKHVLKDVSGTCVAFARMFFGSIFMLIALSIFMPDAFIGILSFSFEQVAWIGITACFLFLYVFTYYNGLKYLPVHKATSMLLLAQPITAFLSASFLGKALTLEKALGALLIVCGVVLLIGFSYVLSWLGRKVPFWAQQRA